MPDAKADIVTMRDLFGSVYRFEVPTYQREFSWTPKEIDDLFFDFHGAFSERGLGVSDTSEYFIGALITQKQEGEAIDRIVDGQQRITSLCVLLSALCQISTEYKAQETLKLLWGGDLANPEFKIGVDSYENLFRRFSSPWLDSPRGARPKGVAIDLLEKAFNRFSELLYLKFLEVASAEDLTEDQRKSSDTFTDWILDNVYAVLIQDTNPYDDQRLFDRLNSRGLPISDADRFRSRVLSSASASDSNISQKRWLKNRQNARAAFEGWSSTAARDSVEAERRLLVYWLMGRYAVSGNIDLDESRANKIQKDPYEFMDTEMEFILAGAAQNSMSGLLSTGFFPYVVWAQKAYQAMRTPHFELLGLRHGLIMKVPYIEALVAACFQPGSKANSNRKLEAVSRFIDIVASRRAWRGSELSPSRMRQLVIKAMFQTRRCNADQLPAQLVAIVAGLPELAEDMTPGLDSGNRTWIRYCLARLTLHAETITFGKQKSRYVLSGKGDTAPEIEHTIARNYQPVVNAFGSKANTDIARNRLGALIILPRRINRELSNLALEEKLPRYAKDNILAASIVSSNYTPSLKFKKAKSHTLDLQPHDSASPTYVEQREKLYTQIARDLWSPTQIAEPIS